MYEQVREIGTLPDGRVLVLGRIKSNNIKVGIRENIYVIDGGIRKETTLTLDDLREIQKFNLD